MVHFAAYWGTVALVRYAYYPHTNVDRGCAKGSMLNQAFSFPLFVAYEHWRPAPLGAVHALWQVLALYYLTDVYFYAFHRAFHAKTLYAAFHRVHHEHDDPCPENALHAHPVEHLVVNSGAILAPLFLVRAGTLIATAWVFLVSVNVVAAHSTKTDERLHALHTLHHRHRSCNYGVGSYAMDRVFGTFRAYEK